MPQVLYIVGKAGLPDRALFPPAGMETQSSVVLIQDAVGLSEVPAQQVYTLQEDLTQRQMSSRFPAISYGDLLRLIFEADRVVAC